MRVNLSGKVALVTGAARGIGQAIADLYTANGALVVYADIDIEAAQKVSANAQGSMALRMDVSSEEEVIGGVARILESYGRLDILVNNAGVNTLNYRVNIDDFPLGEWERIVNVDLTGLFLVSKYAAKPMIKQGAGRIINIASIAGLVPLRLQSPFVAAKAGVVNLTKAMALELAPQGILVNGIAPGSILTDGTKLLFYGEDGKSHGRVSQMLAHIPLGRPGTPLEVASCALFLAAEESSYVNGHIITVDGGWTAGYHRDF